MPCTQHPRRYAGTALSTVWYEVEVADRGEPSQLCSLQSMPRISSYDLRQHAVLRPFYSLPRSVGAQTGVFASMWVVNIRLKARFLNTLDAASTLESWLMLVLCFFLHYLRLRPPSVGITFARAFALSFATVHLVLLFDLTILYYREAVYVSSSQRELIGSYDGYHIVTYQR